MSQQLSPDEACLLLNWSLTGLSVPSRPTTRGVELLPFGSGAPRVAVQFAPSVELSPGVVQTANLLPVVFGPVSQRVVVTGLAFFTDLLTDEVLWQSAVSNPVSPAALDLLPGYSLPFSAGAITATLSTFDGAMIAAPMIETSMPAYGLAALHMSPSVRPALPRRPERPSDPRTKP
jgi:hypothetical protein